ncbi:MAG: DUF433 domain-containing protein [Limisphaerales bacterium]
MKGNGPITVDPEIHSGEPVFAGTRVPIKTLFEYIESGLTLGVFLHNFPSVKCEQALEVLEAAASNLLKSVERTA